MRTVPLITLFNLIKEKPLSLMGILFTLIPLLVFIPLLSFFVSNSKSSFDRYDYQDIIQHGQAATATIKYLKPVGNVTINGENPLLIYYNYPGNDATKEDVFQSFELDKTRNFKVGDKIRIKYYQGQSVIEGLKKFSFPYHLFFLIPLIFMAIGLPFLLVGLLPALKKFNLYKKGAVKKANLISMTPQTGTSALGLGHNVLVNYCFMGEDGRLKFDKATTSDFSILNEKKADDILKILVSENDKSSCLVPRLENLKYNWGV
jgi:hypothetical protein